MVSRLDLVRAALWPVVKQAVGACPLGGLVPDWSGLVYFWVFGSKSALSKSSHW